MEIAEACSSTYVTSNLESIEPAQNQYLEDGSFFTAENINILDNVNLLCDILSHSPKNLISIEKVLPVIKKVLYLLRQENKILLNSNPINVFSCQSCQGVLAEPITIACGHTYCKKCLLKDIDKCKLCNKVIKDLGQFKCNVLISSIVEKCWKNELEVLKKKNDANKLFRENKLQDALLAYNYAVEKVPNDHILLSNRCHTLQLLGRSEEALADANAACCAQPSWPKAHYRRAGSLISLGRHDEAIVALLKCGVLETKEMLPDVHLEIAKLFRLLMNKHPWKSKRSEQTKKYSLRTDPFQGENCLEKNKYTRNDKVSKILRKRKLFGQKYDQKLNEKNKFINSILEKFQAEIERDKCVAAYKRTVNGHFLDKSDFECTLCFHYLLQPVSTPCGHTFCRTCLDRSLDHTILCPLCKNSLKEYLKERRSATNAFIEEAMKILFPNEVTSRRDEFLQEMNQYANAGKDKKHEIPIFVATLAIPTIPCPLHVYEPRYRLMIRRCMEVGTREFGMCMPLSTQQNGYSDVGTMLEIREVEYAEDGRSIVSTIGSRRFRCLSKSTKDGYNTAKVEFLKDAPILAEDLEELKENHEAALKLAQDWFADVEAAKRARILDYYGPMPPIEEEYWLLTDGPSWIWWFIAILPLESAIQMRLIEEITLKKRLTMIIKIVKCIKVYQTTNDR